MSAKQLLRLAVLLSVLLLVWGAAALARRRELVPATRDAFRLPPITRSTADTVVLARGADTTVLAKKDTSAWTVDGHPASQRAVGEFFDELGDSTRESELVAERRASHAGLGVDSAGGTRVRIRGGGRTLADLVAGHQSPDFSGGYLRRADQETTYLVHGRLVDLLKRRTDDWREHAIAAVAADSVATIEVTREKRSFALRREGGGFVLAPGGPADSAAAASLLAAYRTVEASGFASPAQADSARFTPPDRRTRLLRKDGTPLLTLLFDSTASGFWIRPDTGKTIYRIEHFAADQLAPADSSLRARARGGKGK